MGDKFPANELVLNMKLKYGITTMKKLTVAVLTVFAIGIFLNATPATAHRDGVASAEMIDTEGKSIGKVSFEQAPTGVLVSVEVTGLPPGPHGIHLHSVGACSPDFKAAKGHINPNKAAHGLLHKDGPDNGDLPNLFVAADGTGMAEFFTTRVSIISGETGPALLDKDGSTVIIHANPDDHVTQPIGGAGGRIACGVIEG